LATLAAPGVSATARSRPDVTDHDLVQAVRAGDDHAFERLYHRYHRRISAYIFGMVHDHGRAEDLTQEVFVSALRRMRQTDRPIAFKPWVYEIAKNACIDAFRRSKRAEEVSIDAEDGHGLGPADHGKLHATGPSPEAAVEGKQELAHLQGAFGGLSDAHHQILVMRELEGLSYREIGERLGMSRPSVESTLFRARRRLTEEFEELRTGERCVRIQEIIGRGADAGGRLGTRDQRRLSSHVSHCQPCRKHAVMAGLDAGVIARRPVRAKIAALLPLPAFLKRRWLGGDSGSSDAASAHVAQHGPALAQASLAAAQYGETTMAGWMKATLVAAAVAVAGIGAGAADHAASGGAGHRDAPNVKSVSGGSGSSASSPATGGAQRSPARTLTGGGAGVSSRTSSTGRTGRGASGAAGDHAGGTGTFSGGSAGSGSGAGASGGSDGGGKGTTSSSAKPSADAGSGSTSLAGATKPAGVGSTTDAVTNTVNDAAGATTGTVGGATGGASQPPLVKPDVGQLTQPASTPPQTPGQVVSGATGVVGGTAGGQVGDAVTQTGAAVGDTVDKVTTGVTDAATGVLGGGGK
jgi:RNA polymerase sigma factor (sigma-70 family)